MLLEISNYNGRAWGILDVYLYFDNLTPVVMSRVDHVMSN
jgi:hypothetical protein